MVPKVKASARAPCSPFDGSRISILATALPTSSHRRPAAPRLLIRLYPPASPESLSHRWPKLREARTVERLRLAVFRVGFVVLHAHSRSASLP